jgi:cinnamyl-alcohol dehydrogenase
VGVGYFVDSCRTCKSCSKGYENYCPTVEHTSNGVGRDGATTHGGFSDVLVVNQDYVLRVPENLPLDGAAPLLCAGVTVYSPMMRHGLNAPGKHLGVVGLGGLGHMAVKFGKAVKFENQLVAGWFEPTPVSSPTRVRGAASAGCLTSF